MPRQTRSGTPDSPAPDAGRHWVYYPGATPASGPFLGPGGIPGFLRRRLALILGIFVVVAAAVGAWTYTLPKRFESSASFLMERPRAASSEALAILDRVGEAQTTETESELLLGRRVVEPVVDAQDLHLSMLEGDGAAPTEVFAWVEAGRDAQPGTYRVEFTGSRYVARDEATGEPLASGPPGGVLEFANVRLGLPDETEGRPASSLLQVLPFSQAVEGTLGRLSTTSSHRQSLMLRLTCTGGSPDSAHALCSQVTDSYLALRSELQRAEATAAAAFLGEQAHRVEQDLAEAEESLRVYRSRSRAVALEQQASEAVVQAAGLQATRRELEAERGALSSLIARIESEDAGPEQYRQLASFPTFLQSSDVVSRLMESLVDLENRRADLAVRRTDQDPELAAVDARIEDIEGQLLGIARAYQESLTAQVASIDGSIREQGRDLARVPTQQLESARLERRVQVLDGLYRYLQTRLQEAEVAKAVALPSVRVVDPPSLPYAPSWPNGRLNMALGLFLGASTGLLGGLLREYTDRRVHGGQDVLDCGVPVLTTVPRVPRKMLPVAARLPNPGAYALESQRSSLRVLETLHESFQALAFELEAAGDRLSASGVGSVAITSAGRGEGKTFCSASLAIQSAVRGQRTLLVDADPRARGVERWFGLRPGNPGLLDLMGREEDPGTRLSAMIQPVEVADGVVLDVLAAGRENSAAPRLVTSRLQRLLRRAEEEYDLVVVDTPPVTLLSDAAQVASQVEGVVVVVRAGVTERPALERAFVQLSRVGGHVVGIVLNEINESDHYGQYGAYPVRDHADA